MKLAEAEYSQKEYRQNLNVSEYLNKYAKNKNKLKSLKVAK